MKKLILLLSLVLVSGSLNAQEVTHLKPEMFIGIQEIQLGQLDGWKFKPGNDADWAKNDADVSTWQLLKPTQLSKAMANENGRIEGWFKLKVKLDESFGNQQLGIRFYCWAAVDLYIDGKFIKSFGSTGANGKPYEEFNPGERLPIPVEMKGGNEYVIAFHFVDEVATYPAFGIKSNQTRLDQFIKLTGPEYQKTFGNYLQQQPVFYAISMSICAVLILLFLLLALQNKREKLLWLIVLFMFCVCLAGIFSILTYGQNLDFYQYRWAVMIEDIIRSLTYLIIPIILCNIFKRKMGWDLKFYLFLNGFAFCLGMIPFYQDLLYLLAGLSCSIYYLISVRKTLKNAPTKTILATVLKSIRVFLLMTVVLMPLMFTNQKIVPMLMILVLLCVSAYIVFSSWKTATTAQWAIIIGVLLSLIFLALGLAMSISYATTIFPFSRFINVAITLAFPISLLVYVALRFKEILSEVVALSEEKNEILSMQNERLELEVSARTSQLNQSMQELKATQSQLIQSEKMASLGELTAGIAHEIQNPLNFVNNFSDVSNELIVEIEEERGKSQESRDETLINDNLNDIKQNLEKISHHGKRADSIVKGMLQHSRSSSSTKEPTDINKLVDEYLRLAYHGLRAKDNSFNAILETDYDDSIEKIEIVPQDMGRVILNLITNAFHAVDERRKSPLTPKGGMENATEAAYEPTVSIATKKENGLVLIAVKDNGNGIPDAIKEKIFQPFFTTKPTGQGTGLGLSLAYDIVKAHGGELKVSTKENEGTTFCINLPINSVL